MATPSSQRPRKAPLAVCASGAFLWSYMASSRSGMSPRITGDRRRLTPEVIQASARWREAGDEESGAAAAGDDRGHGHGRAGAERADQAAGQGAEDELA